MMHMSQTDGDINETCEQTNSSINLASDDVTDVRTKTSSNRVADVNEHVQTIRLAYENEIAKLHENYQ
jgi:hypothetical protein